MGSTMDITTTSSFDVTVGSTLKLSATTAIDMDGSYIAGYEFQNVGTGRTSNKQTGILQSASSALAAGSYETITLTNSRITASSAVLVSVQSGCTDGMIVVTSVTPAAGSVAIIVSNLGVSACGSVYKLAWFVINNTP